MQRLIDTIKQHGIPNADCLGKLLLDQSSINNVDVNQFGTRRKTALHHAVKARNVEAVRILLEHGADVNSVSVFGMTPLCSVDNIMIAKLLIKYGANLYHSDNFGNTPIIYALYHNDDIIKLLIEQCVDIYRVDDHSNRSPFEYARNYSTPEKNRLLTSYRAYIQLLYFTMVFPDLPTYIILWIVDWLDLREMTQYTKVKYIEGFKRSIDNIRSKKLIDL